MAYFPLFIDLNNANCLVVGGGEIALHKVKVLLDFGANVVVAAKEFVSELRDLEKANPKQVQLLEKPFEDADVENMTLVVAATNVSGCNHEVTLACKSRKIPVNAVDQPRDCTFIFPSYVKEQNLVAAFSSGGNSPLLTQILKEEEKRILTPKLGLINECLGTSREIVQDKVPDCTKRKEIYRKIYEAALEEEQLLSPERIMEIIEHEL